MGFCNCVNRMWFMKVGDGKENERIEDRKKIMKKKGWKKEV